MWQGQKHNQFFKCIIYYWVYAPKLLVTQNQMYVIWNLNKIFKLRRNIFQYSVSTHRLQKYCLKKINTIFALKKNFLSQLENNKISISR